MKQKKTILLAAILCIVGGVKMMAEDLTDPLFASTSGNEIAYHILCRSGYYFDSNTSPTQTKANYGKFAFYKVDGVDKAYYIKCIDTNKWLTYDNTQTGTDGKGFVSFSDTQDNYFIMEGSSQDNQYSYRIRPVNESGEANNFLNWHGGESGYTQTIGLWNSSGGNNVHYTLELVGTTTVIDKSTITNDKYYFISSVRGTLTLNTANTATISDRTSNGKTINSNADLEASKWAIVTYNGSKYLYNLKAKKFLGSGSNLADDITGATALTLADLENTSGERLFKFTQSSSTWINNNNSGNFGLISYNSEDNGNKLRIREGGDIEDIGTVTSLSDIRNDRLYTLTSERGGVVIRNDEVGICSSTNTDDKSTSVGADLWALLTFNNNKYFYNIASHKFLRANNKLDTYSDASNDAMTIENASSPSGDYKFKVKNGGNYLNNANNGSVALDGWTTEDGGNRLWIISVCEFDPSLVTDVTYDIYYNNEPMISGTYILFKDTAPVVPIEIGRDFLDYDYNNVTTITGNQTIRVDATWNGPFLLPATYSDITEWYDMAVRGNYYVTSARADGNGALAPVEANALGLAEDDYQWAFVGDPWHIKIYNKDKGSSQAFAWTSNGNGSIPTFVDATTANIWQIKASNSSISNSFMLTIPIDGYQVNQFGGSSGSLKIWADTRLTDVGSAFVAFTVPTDFHQYAVAEIQPYAAPTGYFALKDVVKTSIGWQDSYATECPFATYKSMKEALEAIDLTDMNNYNLPATGYYRFKNKTSQKYMGLKGTEVLSNYENADAIGAATVVYLTRSDENNEVKYSIKLQGQYLQEITAESQEVPLGDSPALFKLAISVTGYGAFSVSGSGKTYLHHKDNNKVVGWSIPADASNWKLEDAENVTIPLNVVSGKSYATMYLPFDVTLSGTDAYTVAISGERAQLSKLDVTTIPAGTPVLLVNESGESSTTASITSGASALGLVNALAGTYVDKTSLADNEYIFGTKSGELGFWKMDSGKKVGANKAFLVVPAGTQVKGFSLAFSDEDCILGIDNEQLTKDSVIYNIAGQRLNKLQRGMNIVNGKKVIVK